MKAVDARAEFPLELYVPVQSLPAFDAALQVLHMPKPPQKEVSGEGVLVKLVFSMERSHDKAETLLRGAGGKTPKGSGSFRTRRN